MTRVKAKLVGESTVERGSGNVFADLDNSDAETHQLKAALVTRIDQILRQLHLTQMQAAKLLGLSQPDVSRLLRGNFREYSIERLLRLLMRLGRDVEIVVSTPQSSRHGRLSVDSKHQG